MWSVFGAFGGCVVFFVLRCALVWVGVRGCRFCGSWCVVFVLVSVGFVFLGVSYFCVFVICCFLLLGIK